jgi:hypothetical protein
MTQTNCMTDCLMLVYRDGYRSGNACQPQLWGSQVEPGHRLNTPHVSSVTGIHKDYVHCHQYSKQTVRIGNYLLPPSGETTNPEKLLTKI